MNAKGNKTKVAAGKSETVQQIPDACADETKAVEFFERARWGSTAACLRCGSLGVYQMTDKDGGRSKRFLWRCRDCKGQFTVRVGSILEDSPIPMRHWALIFWLMCSGKKSVSAMQVHRMTGLTYKSALFAVHRVRWAMADEPGSEPMTGTVECDETYVGGRPRKENNEGPGARKQGMKADSKVPVVAAIQRGGKVRAQTMQRVTAKNLRAFLLENVSPEARLMTDESRLYTLTGRPFAGGHETVNHSANEYARGDAHVNSAEGFFSLLKRQIYGTHHAVSKKHLHRYVSEAGYKYNTRGLDDGARTLTAIKRGDGKRLTHKQQTAA